MTWDDLKYILALMRGGSLSKAARQLKVDKTTVSRRVAALEEALGAVLVERGGHGQMRLTRTGRKVAGQAEAMEDVERRIRADLGAQPDGLAGRVRLSTVPILAHHVLLPQLGELCDLAPGLKVELLAEARDADVLEGEADIALRLARPRTGGQGVLTRKIGVMSYGCYAASMVGGDLPWIGFEPNMQHLEIAQAIETLANAPGSRRAGLSVNDAEGLLRAVQAGLGMSLLPRIIADAVPGLRRLDVDETHIPERELWVLTRRDQAGLDRIRVVQSWLDGIFSAA
ncbi:LysR family transcriptional regulator [Roseovarius phycicola]|uniref:LysR family transcriptional regulator n=1 Tax=Roseovarius phycicola TaxID=3080976 RepID=A0ABZ2HPW0_9RHOB